MDFSKVLNTIYELGLSLVNVAVLIWNSLNTSLADLIGAGWLTKVPVLGPLFKVSLLGLIGAGGIIGLIVWWIVRG